VEYAPYYRNFLLYLACVDLEKDMSPAERLIRAHDLSISALLGDTIYNFGELVSNPMMNFNSIILKTPIFACIQLMHLILDSLNGTQHPWSRCCFLV
jgi:26S proteasome regulatory subunit N9